MIFSSSGFIYLSSPHIQTIRERVSVGRSGDPVSVKTLNSLFQRIKKVLDQAVQFESGRLSHFEVISLHCLDSINIRCNIITLNVSLENW